MSQFGRSSRIEASGVGGLSVDECDDVGMSEDVTSVVCKVGYMGLR